MNFRKELKKSVGLAAGLYLMRMVPFQQAEIKKTERSVQKELMLT